MRQVEVARLERDIHRARSGPAEAYAEVLQRGLAACGADADAADYLDILGLHSELAETYDQLDRVEDALRHADVLAEQGYASQPDPRCRRAEILTRHGRLEEAAAIWDAVARDTPEDVWVYNNAGLEYQAIGEHETALSWLTRGLELAVRTGDPERLVDQLRDVRGACLAALGREPDALQNATPVRSEAARLPPAFQMPATTPAWADRASAGVRPEPTMVPVWAWVPADEYADLAERWPDLVDTPVVRDEETGRRVDHAVYSRGMEERLRAARDVGITGIHIAPLRSSAFGRWVAANDLSLADPSELRAQYAAHLGHEGSQVIAGPPGRNEPCWCGSGRKYKKCCGAPGLGGAG